MAVKGGNVEFGGFRREVKIAPSLLSADFGNLETEIAQFDPSITDYLHIDVMDGQFVPNITVGPDVVRAISGRTMIPLDVHLMIERPEVHIKSFQQAGASILTVHVEACRHLQACLRQIKDLGMKAGVSLNPSTPLTSIENVLEDLDLVLIMSVNPGFGGQQFIPQSLDKVARCRRMIEDYPIELEVDGGVKLSNIKEIHEAGAHVFVSGSEIFGNPPYNEVVKQMKTLLCPKNLQA